MNFDQGFRAKGLALLTLALVFGSGIGIGLAFDRNLNAGIPDSADTEEAPRRGRNAPREPRAMIVEGVGLTLEQKAAVDETVLEQRMRMKVIQEEFKTIEGEFNEQFRLVIRDTREAIKGHLTDEQRERYDALLAEHDERRRKRRENRRREHPTP